MYCGENLLVLVNNALNTTDVPQFCMQYYLGLHHEHNNIGWRNREKLLLYHVRLFAATELSLSLFVCRVINTKQQADNTSSDRHKMWNGQASKNKTKGGQDT